MPLYLHYIPVKPHVLKFSPIKTPMKPWYVHSIHPTVDRWYYLNKSSRALCCTIRPIQSFRTSSAGRITNTGWLIGSPDWWVWFILIPNKPSPPSPINRGVLNGLKKRNVAYTFRTWNATHFSSFFQHVGMSNLWIKCNGSPIWVRDDSPHLTHCGDAAVRSW